MGSSLHYFSYCYPLSVTDMFSRIMLAQQILLGATHIRHIFVAGRAGDVLKHLKHLFFFINSHYSHAFAFQISLYRAFLYQ